MDLRSNFEPGTTRWAVRRTQWKSMGISEEDMEKPKIAVINTSNKLSSCFAHVDKISQAVQNAIKAHGGVPFEVRTVASSDFVSLPTCTISTTSFDGSMVFKDSV